MSRGMNNTSAEEDELARLKGIEKLAQQVKRRWIEADDGSGNVGNAMEELCNALPDVHTPLVCDEDLRRAVAALSHRAIKYIKEDDRLGCWAYERGMIAMGLRKAAEWFETNNRNAAAARQLRKWADKEVGDV